MRDHAHRRRRLLHTLGASLALAALPATARAADTPRTLSWDDLMPAGWDPYKDLRALAGTGSIAEGSDTEQRLMREMRRLWDAAPTRTDLDGALVRLPGYVVPLEASGGQVREFLLVPYFGACIHSPPPPANQIVHVQLAAARALRTMDAVWTTGVLRLARADSPWGISGYGLQARSVEPYKADKARTDTRADPRTKTR